MPFHALLLTLFGFLATRIVCSTSGTSYQSILVPGSVTGGSTTEHIIHSNGKARHYLLHLPVQYDANQPAPLILSFHGNNHNAHYQESLSQFSDKSFNVNSIAVYPQGLNDSWESAPYAVADSRDFDFISALLDLLQSTYNIDVTRVYATGMSNGGGFVGALACNSKLSGRIAAFAPVSGAFYEQLGSTTPLVGPCEPNINRSSIPILEFHGQDDNIIKYNGQRNREGATIPTIPSWLEGWAVRNGCANGTNGHVENLHGGKVNKTSWSCNSHQNVVTGYKIAGWAHWWPTTERSDKTKDHLTVLNATTLIMDFFGKHALD
ncbi:hypothetical protein MMC26_007687 [Xylographa opegraphella]|nr:hypothetical protein [Xylographa opegraphella]